MNRVKDYIQFAVGFVGVGYIVLWPLTAHDNGIAPLEAAFICGHSFGLTDLICHPPHVLRLSPGLHLIGSISVAFIGLRVLFRRLYRRRAPAGDRTALPSAARIITALRQPLAQKPMPPLRRVKPRSHFGLRGVLR